MAASFLSGAQRQGRHAERNAPHCHIHHASFLAEVRPSTHLDVSVRLLEHNGYTAIWAGQLMNREAVCCIGVLEAYFAVS
jgi:acyl-CoA thioesterase FadM